MRFTATCLYGCLFSLFLLTLWVLLSHVLPRAVLTIKRTKGSVEMVQLCWTVWGGSLKKLLTRRSVSDAGVQPVVIVVVKKVRNASPRVGQISKDGPSHSSSTSVLRRDHWHPKHLVGVQPGRCRSSYLGGSVSGRFCGRGVAGGRRCRSTTRRGRSA